MQAERRWTRCGRDDPSMCWWRWLWQYCGRAQDTIGGWQFPCGRGQFKTVKRGIEKKKKKKITRVKQCPLITVMCYSKGPVACSMLAFSACPLYDSAHVRTYIITGINGAGVGMECRNNKRILSMAVPVKIYTTVLACCRPSLGSPMGFLVSIFYFR